MSRTVPAGRGVVTPDQLARLQGVTRDLVEASRQVTESDEICELGAGHGPDSPRLTRIKPPHLRHPSARR